MTYLECGAQLGRKLFMRGFTNQEVIGHLREKFMGRDKGCVELLMSLYVTSQTDMPEEMVDLSLNVLVEAYEKEEDNYFSFLRGLYHSMTELSK